MPMRREMNLGQAAALLQEQTGKDVAGRQSRSSRSSDWVRLDRLGVCGLPDQVHGRLYQGRRVGCMPRHEYAESTPCAVLRYDLLALQDLSVDGGGAGADSKFTLSP